MGKLQAFFAGELYARMAASPDCRREFHFTVEVPVAQVDPTVSAAGETVVVQGIADCVFREGDALYDSDSGTQIGTITKVEAAPAETIVPLPDGTAEWGTMEGRSDVYLTVEATGTVTDSRQYLVNKTYQINVGSKRNLTTKYRSFEGTIWSIG